jgi:hypothetical protein
MIKIADLKLVTMFFSAVGILALPEAKTRMRYCRNMMAAVSIIGCQLVAYQADWL